MLWIWVLEHGNTQRLTHFWCQPRQTARFCLASFFSLPGVHTHMHVGVSRAGCRRLRESNTFLLEFLQWCCGSGSILPLISTVWAKVAWKALRSSNYCALLWNKLSALCQANKFVISHKLLYVFTVWPQLPWMAGKAGGTRHIIPHKDNWPRGQDRSECPACGNGLVPTKFLRVKYWFS